MELPNNASWFLRSMCVQHFVRNFQWERRPAGKRTLWSIVTKIIKEKSEEDANKMQDASME